MLSINLHIITLAQLDACLLADPAQLSVVVMPCQPQPGWLSMLDHSETQRYQRITHRPTQQAYLCAHWLKRRILSGLIGQPSQQLRFAAQAQGKPYLQALPHQVSYQFNLSHTHHLCAVAVHPYAMLGVDIETLKPRTQYQTIAPAFLHPQEGPAEYLSDLQLLQLWTQKEAITKAMGLGLQYDFRSIRLQQSLHQQVDCNGETWMLYSQPLAADTWLSLCWPARAVAQPRIVQLFMSQG